MSELLVALVAALPALAALGLIGTRSTPLLGRVWRGTPRPVKLAAFALAIAACHPSCNDYARGPVPQATLPFAEPVAYASGPNAGRPVESRNGLLASYFAGTNYDRLDHQQIDPNVDFAWDATGQNPVIPDATVANHGLDENHGFGEVGPPRWGIWSVVWEGYLEAPADGPYLLGVHANNGGWLEMKRAAGGLETVVANPGGPSFEGTVTATRTLAAGRHYLRLSYYQSGAPTGVARLLWQPPGAAGLSVIPPSALCTQDIEGCSQPKRGVIFVHGITGDFTKDAFTALLNPLRAAYRAADGGPAFTRFQYFQDVGNVGASGCRDRDLGEVLPYNTTVGYPVDLPRSGAPPMCDSNDDVGVNGLFLESDVRFFRHLWQVDKITLIANSMGGAVVRAYLAYASATRGDSGKQDTLAIVDSVIFLQGVQQGAYPLAARDFFDEHPVLHPVRDAVIRLVKDQKKIDADRPAAADLTPRSEMIAYVNRLEHVPPGLRYLNVRSDISVQVVTSLFPWEWPAPMAVGDYLLMPGEDHPALPPERLPELGGAGFLPSTVAAGRSSGQWTLRAEERLFLHPVLLPTVPSQVTALMGKPESHFAFGGRIAEVCVETIPGRKRVHEAILDAIRQFDEPVPTLDVVHFGNLRNARCSP